MSVKRHAQLMSSITSAAGKVYECVPMQTHWPVGMVHAELLRRGVNMAHQSAAGCLDSLVRIGLIKETRDGFIRVPLREKLGLTDLKSVITPRPEPEPVPETKEAPMTSHVTTLNTSAPAAQKSVVDILGALAQQIAATTLRHQQELKALADLIADAAIEVQAELEKKDADLAKWNQLQVLLKGVAA